VRWEKTTRPFLRSREFWWQEGHTIHATAEEAEAETRRMLDIYAEFAESYLALGLLKGKKTDSEKFAGAVSTYAIESMMHDGKGLQAGTTHYFGDGFARAFGIQFTDQSNQLRYPFQTSWGVTTRLIGAFIMTHGDDNGLVVPPRIAPTQVVVVPVAVHKPGVLEAARALTETLRRAGLRVKLDERDQSPGWKFAEHEVKGVPLRVELGPRDLDRGQCVLARRDTGVKSAAPLEGLPETAKALLADIQASLLRAARANLANRTRATLTLDEMKALAPEGGFIKAMWCGDSACEESVKEATGMKPRCIPFTQERVGDACVCCGKKADTALYWGFQY
jgi:prolyl-tRNA synthetase